MKPSSALTAQADAAGAFETLFLGMGAVALLVGVVGVERQHPDGAVRVGVPSRALSAGILPGGLRRGGCWDRSR
jgi:hypothetical protein